MIEQFKRLFQKPNAQSIALIELEESKRALLHQQAASEYHAKLVEYYKIKISRLNHYVHETR